MMKIAIRATLLMALTVSAFSSTHAVPILDQQQLPTSNGSSLIGQFAGTPVFSQEVGQTLTVGTSGLLTQVDFALERRAVVE